MKQTLKILVAFAIIVLIIMGALWLIPFHELSKGQLAIIGYTVSGRSIYLFDPFLRSWRRLPTDNLYPWHIAWSPDGMKIAFTYSTSNGDDPTTVTGVAILNLENMTTEKLYVAPPNENTYVATWSLDGQSLIFDINENRLLTAFQKLNVRTGKLELIPFDKNLQPQYFSINQLEVAQNNDYVIGSSDGSYIASPDLKNLRLITEFGDINGFFLTPDRKEITILCKQAPFCNYNMDTNTLTEIYNVEYSECCVFSNGNWSYDEKDVVYLMQGGFGEPQYIILNQGKQEFVIYKHHGQEGSLSILQLAWHSVK
jgi:WD40 repeat protein